MLAGLNFFGRSGIYIDAGRSLPGFDLPGLCSPGDTLLFSLLLANIQRDGLSPLALKSTELSLKFGEPDG